MVVTHYNDICRKLFNKANYTNREKVKKKYSMKMALIEKNGFLKRKKKTQIIVLYVVERKEMRKIVKKSSSKLLIKSSFCQLC